MRGQQDQQIRYRVINETTLNDFYQEFSMKDTTQIINEPDANEALIKLDKKIQECYDKCCQLKVGLYLVRIRLIRE